MDADDGAVHRPTVPPVLPSMSAPCCWSGGWSRRASGPAAYANVQAFTGSIIGRLIVFGYTWALMHHMLSGIRHLVWDLGYGFQGQ